MHLVLRGSSKVLVAAMETKYTVLIAALAEEFEGEADNLEIELGPSCR